MSAAPLFRRQGSHGTCADFATSIVKEGRFRSSYGLKGDGSYFWLQGRYCQRLALSWFKQNLERSKYNHSKDKQAAVLIVDVECTPQEVLDLLSDFETRELLAELVDKVVGANKTIAEVSKGYDQAISIIEKKNACKMKVLLSTVIGPEEKYCSYYNYISQGSPSCVIVRDGSVIKNITRISKEDILKL